MTFEDMGRISSLRKAATAPTTLQKSTCPPTKKLCSGPQGPFSLVLALMGPLGLRLGLTFLAKIRGSLSVRRCLSPHFAAFLNLWDLAAVS